MSTPPWLKFYPRDWRGDQALRAVSLSARGLWMECLCIMHEAKPYGHLLLNGEPIEDDALARMAGASVDEVRTALSELRQAGVLGLTRTGVIFSRRMTRDFARAQKGRKAAQTRWQQPTENAAKSEPPNRLPNRDPTTQKPEARYQKEKVGSVTAPPNIRMVRSTPPPDPPASAGRNYVFEGRVIRLKQADFDRWREAYPLIPDLAAELQAADDYYSDRPPKDGKWFFATSNWLKKANAEAGERAAAVKAKRREETRGVDWG